MNKKKESSEKEERKRKLCYISLMIIMLVPISYASLKFKEYYGVWFSVQYFVVIITTIIMEIFLLARLLNLPNIDNLKLNAAKLYFSTTITVMLATFAAFGIAFSILWGNLYTYALQVSGGEKYIDNLKGQGFILLLFIVFSSAAVLFAFLLPLIHQINKKEI